MSPQKDKLLNVLVAIMTGLALVMVGVRFGAWLSNRNRPVAGTAMEIPSPERYWNGRIVVGDSDAVVTVVVFSDFQCPFCRSASDDYMSLLQESGGDLRIIFRNLPLEQLHPSARLLAAGGICSYSMGDFKEYHNRVFALQDTLKSLSEGELVTLLHPESNEEFRACMSSAWVQDVIEQDLAAADELGATATPTLIVGRRMYIGNPGRPLLDSLFQLARQETER